MEIRTLKYFLAVCREGNMSRAAAALHLTQPTLSRQISDLERELGCELLVRGRELELTEQGMLLRRRAAEIVRLTEQAEDEIKAGDTVEGEIRIAAGESRGITVLAAEMRRMREDNPHVTFAIHSGNGEDAAWRLDRGLADFAVFMAHPHLNKYEHMRLEPTDVFGLLMPKGHPLAKLEAITPSDLPGIPLIASEGTLEAGPLSSWCGRIRNQLDVAATYTLAFNAAMLVEEGVGCALVLDGIIAADIGTGFEFRPLDPTVASPIDLAWKKNSPLAPAPKAFLKALSNRVDPPAARRGDRASGE